MLNEVLGVYTALAHTLEHTTLYTIMNKSDNWKNSEIKDGEQSSPINNLPDALRCINLDLHLHLIRLCAYAYNLAQMKRQAIAMYQQV